MIMVVVGVWAYGVIRAQWAVSAEAAREDINGQIILYATSPDADSNMTADYETSYTDAVSAEFRRPNQNVVEALIAAHKQVNARNSRQRPILSNSLNGFIYLARQPPNRRKRAILVAVDDPSLDATAPDKAPQHDVEAMASALRASGFAADEVQVCTIPRAPKSRRPWRPLDMRSPVSPRTGRWMRL